MASTNKLSQKDFKLLNLDVIKKIEAFKTGTPPMSTCLPSSLYIWDTNNACYYLEVSPTLFLIKRNDWMDSAQTVHAATHVNSIDDLIALKDAANALGIKELHEISFLNQKASELPAGLGGYEDLDHAEYVYETSSLSELSGSQYSEIRSKIRKFNKLYKHSFVADKNPPDEKDIENILNLYESWVDLAGYDVESAAQKEKEAFYKLISAYKAEPQPNFAKNQLFYYLSVNGQLIGFSVVELVNSKYGVGHFLKLNHNVTGVSEYFIHSISKDLLERGVELLNAEEDLGNEGLRNFKHRLRPSKLLIPYKLLLG